MLVEKRSDVQSSDDRCTEVRSGRRILAIGVGQNSTCSFLDIDKPFLLKCHESQILHPPQAQVINHRVHVAELRLRRCGLTRLRDSFTLFMGVTHDCSPLVRQSRLFSELLIFVMPLTAATLSGVRTALLTTILEVRSHDDYTPKRLVIRTTEEPMRGYDRPT